MSKQVHLILKTTGDSAGGETLTSGLDCAVLELTPELLRLIQTRCVFLQELHDNDDQAYEICFWHYGPVFYEYEVLAAFEELPSNLINDVEQRRWDDYGYAVLPAGLVDRLDDDLEHCTCRTECNQMVVSCAPHPQQGLTFSVHWVVIPRHAGHYVDTENIDLDQLTKFLEDAQ